MIRITQTPFAPEAEYGAFQKAIKSSGAIASFAGYVRGEYGEVSTLTLQHYPGFTEKKVQEIADTALSRWPLEAVRIVHRTGEMKPGDAIVFVAAASAHRRAAFEAADFMMDFLKSEAPFWKKERRGETETWIEPSAKDLDDKSRWQKDKSA